MPIPAESTTDPQANHKVVYLYNPLWLPVYTMFCVLGSIPFLLVTIPMGLSAASDSVFGALVIVGGPLGDYIFRKIFKRTMLTAGKVQAIWIWPFVGVLIMMFHPLE